MITKSIPLPLDELIAQRLHPKWKNSASLLQVEQFMRKTRSNSALRKTLIGSLAVATYMDSCPSENSKGRDYNKYNSIFKPYLKKDILDVLCDIAERRKSHPLRILEDGAGYGRFLHQVKLMLKDRGIATETSAITLEADDQLKSSNVDFLYEGESQSFVPEKRQDVIISVMGTLYYSPRELNKEIILKHAYALTEGGYLLLTTSGVFPGLLDPDKAKLDKIYGGIISSFEKRGFNVIAACDDRQHDGIVIVERPRTSRAIN